MNIKRLRTVALAATVLIGTSCKKEGCTDPTATNYSEKAKKNDGTCEYAPIEPVAVTPSYTTPTTYAFTDDDGNNTVSYGGQTIRLEMLEEMTTYMKTANIAGTSVSGSTLKNMYANNGYTWTDGPALGMTGSTKQLKSKTAEGDIGIQSMFETYMDSIDLISASTSVGLENGMPGTAGVFPNDGVKGPYLMSAKGVEYTQLIEKGLMCAVFMNQMTVNYLEGLGSDDNLAASDPSAGKYYTEMEHHWDEAYGYFTSAVDYPTSGTDRFWGKYANSREALLNTATKIGAAFRLGRAAISNGDYTVRDEQTTIIRNEMEKVCAGTAIHYLNDAKANIGNNTARNHYISEAVAFLEGLKYGYNAINATGMSNAQIDNALGLIGDDFNSVTLANLQSAIDEIANNTGLSSVSADL
jgi:hypothetical protein